MLCRGLWCFPWTCKCGGADGSVKSMVQKEGLNDSPRRTALLVAERFKEFGLAGFYRGLSMQLIRSVPVHSLNFYIYESVLSYCRKE